MDKSVPPINLLTKSCIFGSTYPSFEIKLVTICGFVFEVTILNIGICLTTLILILSISDKNCWNAIICDDIVLYLLSLR